MTVETLEKWSKVAEILHGMGYTIFQMQYGTDVPEGLHVRFWAATKPDVMVVTHNRAVHEAILRYDTER